MFHADDLTDQPDDHTRTDRADRELTGLVGLYSRPLWRDGGTHVAVFAARPLGGLLQPAPGETLAAAYFGVHDLPEALMWWDQQPVSDAFAGAGGSAVWRQDIRWPLAPDATRQDLYDLRDRSGLSRVEFYRQTLQSLADEVTREAGASNEGGP